MRVVPYILYLLLIAFYRIILKDLFSIAGAELLLTPLIVILVARYKKYYEALWFGFAAGLVFDATDPSRLGIQMLILTLLAIITVRFRERLNLESRKSELLLVAGGLFLYTVPYILIYTTSGTNEFFRLFLYIAIPSVIYTTLVAWILDLLKSGKLSYSKIKSIF